MQNKFTFKDGLSYEVPFGTQTVDLFDLQRIKAFMEILPTYLLMWTISNHPRDM